MVLKNIEGLRVLQSELLLAAGVSHGWFDASLGDTQFRPGNPYDDSEFIDEQAMRARWGRACKALGLDTARLVATSGLQTANIQLLSPEHSGKTVGPADAYLTVTPKLPILLRAGDCIQAVLFAPGVLAVVHAGGLGVARGIFVKVVDMMCEQYGVNPTQIAAALGPSIGPEHLIPSKEADGFTLEDIKDAQPVIKVLPDGRQGYDIAATAARQLIQQGLDPAHIEASIVDTFSDPHWFSWERNRATDQAAAMRRHGLFVALP